MQKCKQIGLFVLAHCLHLNCYFGMYDYLMFSLPVLKYTRYFYLYIYCFNHFQEIKKKQLKLAHVYVNNKNLYKFGIKTYLALRSVKVQFLATVA